MDFYKTSKREVTELKSFIIPNYVKDLDKLNRFCYKYLAECGDIYVGIVEEEKVDRAADRNTLLA